MDSLIRYVATDCKIDIGSYTQYVNKICNCIQANGLTKEMLTEPEFTKKVMELPFTKGRRISYKIMYSNIICGMSYNWYIDIDFFEQPMGVELQINITSQTYMINVEETYLTKLARTVEECIDREWGVFVRVIDAYSDMLNMLLVPELHRVENMTRRVVFSMMAGMYGARWWKEYVNEDYCCTEPAESIEYAVSDDRILSMNIEEFDKVITAEWKNCFSQEFSEEFLNYIHKLSKSRKKILSNYRSDSDFYMGVRKAMEGAIRELATVQCRIEHVI